MAMKSSSVCALEPEKITKAKWSLTFGTPCMIMVMTMCHFLHESLRGTYKRRHSIDRFGHSLLWISNEVELVRLNFKSQLGIWSDRMMFHSISWRISVANVWEAEILSSDISVFFSRFHFAISTQPSWDKRRLEKMRSFIVLQLFSFVWTGSFQPETESCWGSFKLNGNKNFQHQRGRTSLGERRKVCL